MNNVNSESPFLPYPPDTPARSSSSSSSFSNITSPRDMFEVKGSRESVSSTLSMGELTENNPQKKACLAFIKESSSFGKLSNEIWDCLSGNDLNPHDEVSEATRANQHVIKDKINKFKKDYKTQIEQIAHTSWKKYISELSKKMEKNPGSKELEAEWKRLGEFRDAIVKLQNELTITAAYVVGIEEVGRWEAFGTPGNSSDIDNTFVADPNLTQTNQMLVKVFSDTFYTHILGSDTLSGLQLDVETYLEHPGSARDTESRISNNSKGQLFYLELSMVFLQNRNAYGEDFEKWKSDQIDFIYSFSDPKLQETLQKIFIEAELFHKQIQIDILSEVIKQNTPDLNPDLLDKLTLNAFTSKQGLETLQKTAEDAVAARNAKFDKAYKQSAMTYKCARMMDLSKQMDEDNLKLAKLKAEDPRRDAIEIRLTARALLRNFFFDESYLSAGAFNIVCHREGGQRSRLRNDDNLKLIEQGKLTSNADLMPIISRETRSSISNLEYIPCIGENTAQFIHYAFDHSTHGDTEAGSLSKSMDRAINSSKYAERTTSNCLKLLNKMSKNSSNNQDRAFDPLQERIKAAHEKAKVLDKQAVGLERCKRQTEINDTTTKKLLRDVLIKKISNLNSPEEQEEKIKLIDLAIDDVMKMFQPEGAYFDQEITAIDKYNLYLYQLQARLQFLTFPSELNLVENDLMLDLVKEKFNTSLSEKSNEKILFDNLSLTDQRALIQYAKKTLADDPNPTSSKFAKVILNTLNSSLAATQMSFSKKIKQKFSHSLATQEKTSISPQTQKPLLYIIAAKNDLRKKLNKEIIMGSSGDPELDAILRAKSGLPRIGDVEVQQLHTTAKELSMMKELGLSTLEEIDSYTFGVKSLFNEVFELSQITEITPKPVQARGVDLVALWQGTHPNPPDIGKSPDDDTDLIDF